MTNPTEKIKELVEKVMTENINVKDTITLAYEQGGKAKEKEILEMIEKLDFSDVNEYSDAGYLINELKSKLKGENLK